MFELDFFGLINGAGIDWMVFVTVLTSLFTVLSGAIWPLMEKWMEKVEAESLLAACQEIDAGELERLSREIEEMENWMQKLVRGKRSYEFYEYEERVNLLAMPWLGRSRWELCVRKVELFEAQLKAVQEEIALLDLQIDGIWSTPIPI